MPRNGSGAYTQPISDFQPGTLITSADVNSWLGDLGDETTNSLAKDGQTTPTANLPMGGFRHTNCADAAAFNQYATLGQVAANPLIESSSSTVTIDATDMGKCLLWTGSSAGTVNLPAITGVAAGGWLQIRNDGTASLTIDGNGSETINGQATLVVASGEVATIRRVTAEWVTVSLYVYPQNSVTTLGADMVLTALHAGIVKIWLSSANATFTLPAANAAGGRPIRFTFVRTDTTTYTATVQRAGSDTIEGDVSLTVPRYSGITLASDGVSTWYVVGEAGFGGSITQNGWKQLPSGLIIQWGQSVTDGTGGRNVVFPITFPTSAFSVSIGSLVTSARIHSYQSITASGFYLQSWNPTTGGAAASLTATWIALGN